MSINFTPHPATVLMCDYSTGFVPPEMVKRRLVIVLSASLAPEPYLVVPLSTTVPHKIRPHHVRLRRGRYAFLRGKGDVWVKCNLIAAVAPIRLDRLQYGPLWIAPTIDRADFDAVRVGVLHALGLGHLTSGR
jgi:mRNA interferase MazF